MPGRFQQLIYLLDEHQDRGRRKCRRPLGHHRRPSRPTESSAAPRCPGNPNRSATIQVVLALGHGRITVRLHCSVCSRYCSHASETPPWRSTRRSLGHEGLSRLTPHVGNQQQVCSALLLQDGDDCANDGFVSLIDRLLTPFPEGSGLGGVNHVNQPWRNL